MQSVHVFGMAWIHRRHHQSTKALQIINGCIVCALCIIDICLCLYYHPFRRNNPSRYVVGITGITLFSFVLIFYFVAFYFLKSSQIKKSFIFFLITAVCIIGGFTLKQVDLIYCHSADSLIQLHALFHFLVAVGLTTAYFC